MKLHLPKLLLTAVLAVVALAPGAWADTESTPTYSGTVYTFIGNTSGTDLAFSKLQYVNSNGETATIQGVSGNWGDIAAAIATPGAGDRNTLKLGEGYAKGLTYTFNPIAVAGFIVDASGYSIVTGSTGGSRNIEIGNPTATTAYTTINYDFSVTNNARSDAYIKLLGTQEWTIASTATYTLNAGSASSVVLADGSKTTQKGGTVSFSGDSVTGNGSYIVSSGTLKDAVFKTGTTLKLGGSDAAVSSVTMQSGSTLDVSALTLSADTAVVSSSDITVNDGVVMSIANVSAGSTVKLFDSSVSLGGLFIGGNKVIFDRSDITEDSGSYTFNSIVGNLSDMVWAGGDGTWNTTETNWNSAGYGDGVSFAEGDTVTFSSSAAVTVDGGVTVGGMTVSGSTTVLELTRANSGYIAGDVTVSGGAKLTIKSQTDSTGFVRGDIDVTNGTLQFDAKDVTGYNGGANSTQNIKIAAGSQLLINHANNETFAGDIILNGTMKGIATAAARWDLYGGSASLSVEAGNNATLDNVVLQLRQDDSEITVGEGATLTLASGMNEGSEGNGKFKKLGKGVLTVAGNIAISDISLNAGSLVLSGGGSTGAISMNANDTSLKFSAATGATAEAPTTYTVGDISTTTGNWFNRDITVDEKVKVNATSLTNSWGLGTMKVDGVLNFSGELKMSTGGNTMGQKNIISGTGSVTAATLTTGNVGGYTLSVKSLVATNTTIGQHTQVTAGEADLGALTLNSKLEAKGGKIIISSTTGGGSLTGTSGSIELKSGTHTIGTLDMSNDNTATGTVTLKEGAALTVSNKVWSRNGATIALEKGASLTNGTVKVTGNDTDAPATLSASGNKAYALSGTDGEVFTIANATVTVNTTDAAATISNCLNNSILVNGGAQKLTAANTNNVLSAIDASTGSVDVVKTQAQTLSSLIIGSGKTVGLYTGDSAPATPTSADEATVTTSSLEVKGAGATLKANLVLSDGATVKLADALTMGSSVTLGTGMTLTGDLVSTIQGLGEGETTNLFTGVDELYLGGSTVASGNLTEADSVTLGTYFAGFDDTYYLGYDGQNVFAGVKSPVTPVIPEPTTATLSLLALAALASRRRRK